MLFLPLFMTAAATLAAAAPQQPQVPAADITECRTACKEKPQIVNSASFFACTKNGTLTDADTRTRCTCRDVNLFFDVQTCMSASCPALAPRFRDECDNFTLNAATSLGGGGLFAAAVAGVVLFWSLW